MANYQLPPLKDERLFEELTCDLFNFVENTSSYENTDFQTFGVKGQNQKGIDVFSTKTKTVIQCKLKSIGRKDETIRKNPLRSRGFRVRGGCRGHLSIVGEEHACTDCHASRC